MFQASSLSRKAPLHLAAAAALILVELIPLTIAVDTGNLTIQGGLAGLAATFGSNCLRVLLLGIVLSSILAVGSGAPGWIRALGERTVWRLSPLALAAHFVSFALFSAASLRLFRPETTRPEADWLAFVAFAAGFLTIATALAGFVPAGFWSSLARGAPWALPGGLALAICALGISGISRAVAGPWLRLTLWVSASAIRLFRPDVVILPAQGIIRSSSFEVEISWACAGYEGVGLMLVFGSVWLALFRRDFRFPRALLLLPASLVTIWFLNCGRILTLFLIGDAGAPHIANGGFHSQAGWISFVGLAVCFSLASQRISWFAAAPSHAIATPRAASSDPTAAFLMPFLAIMAASLVSQASSGGFEWAYPLRVIGAALALWAFRRAYPAMDWSVGAGGVLIGVLVFGIWVAAERFFIPGSVPVAAPAAFAAASAAARWTWILFRLVGGIVTVPIAEELAFRGYALRRIGNPDFAAADLRRFGWVAFLVSSLLFGALHGQRWIVGAIAGMLFAWAARRRGSIGDAVAAHSAANLLLAVYALATGDWRFW